MVNVVGLRHCRGLNVTSWKQQKKEFSVVMKGAVFDTVFILVAYEITFLVNTIHSLRFL